MRMDDSFKDSADTEWTKLLSEPGIFIAFCLSIHWAMILDCQVWLFSYLEYWLSTYR